MADQQKAKITVQTTINKPANIVWELWTKPEHIIRCKFGLR
jgi:uncharacterized protein YndB with AHSA1/START domain